MAGGGLRAREACLPFSPPEPQCRVRRQSAASSIISIASGVGRLQGIANHAGTLNLTADIKILVSGMFSEIVPARLSKADFAIRIAHKSGLEG